MKQALVKNIAPEVFRQRLLIEGFYTIDIGKESLVKYLVDLAKHLKLQIYSQPIIFVPQSYLGQEKNAG